MTPASAVNFPICESDYCRNCDGYGIVWDAEAQENLRCRQCDGTGLTAQAQFRQMCRTREAQGD
jgi:DnaJ-class molecular chaperone